MAFPRIVAAFTALIFLPGCASIVAGTHKTVRVQSDPPGAIVRLDGDTRAITPGVLHPSTRSNHLVRVEMAGYEPFEVELVRKHSAWEWGNIVFAAAPGVAFDGITGAVYSFHPDRLDVKLQPLAKSKRR